MSGASTNPRPQPSAAQPSPDGDTPTNATPAPDVTAEHIVTPTSAPQEAPTLPNARRRQAHAAAPSDALPPTPTAPTQAPAAPAPVAPAPPPIIKTPAVSSLPIQRISPALTRPLQDADVEQAQAQPGAPHSAHGPVAPPLAASRTAPAQSAPYPAPGEAAGVRLQPIPRLKARLAQRSGSVARSAAENTRLQSIPRLKERVSQRALAAPPSAPPQTPLQPIPPRPRTPVSSRAPVNAQPASASPAAPIAAPAATTTSANTSAKGATTQEGGTAGVGEAVARRRPRRLWGERNPRVLAALCYALPFVASGATLLGRLGAPRNRFVRLHAAQSLILFTLMGLAQVALFVALVTLGNLAQAEGWFAIALGLVFYALVLGLGVVCLILWLRLIADCMAGRWRRYPLLTALAIRLERWTRPFARRADPIANVR